MAASAAARAMPTTYGTAVWAGGSGPLLTTKSTALLVFTLRPASGV